jgi:hypothetical protein
VPLPLDLSILAAYILDQDKGPGFARIAKTLAEAYRVNAVRRCRA